MKELRVGEWIVPISVIQGGIRVGVSLDKLAGAVAREGGIGMISIAQIGFLEDGYKDAPLKAKIVSGAGLSVDLLRYVRENRMKIAPIVFLVKAADVILKLWDRKY